MHETTVSWRNRMRSRALPGFFMCAWCGALVELLAIAGSDEKPAFPDGCATPIALAAGQGQFPELGRLKDA
jgi:hypothetical protein